MNFPIKKLKPKFCNDYLTPQVDCDLDLLKIIFLTSYSPFMKNNAEGCYEVLIDVKSTISKILSCKNQKCSLFIA